MRANQDRPLPEAEFVVQAGEKLLNAILKLGGRFVGAAFINLSQHKGWGRPARGRCGEWQDAFVRATFGRDSDPVIGRSARMARELFSITTTLSGERIAAGRIALKVSKQCEPRSLFGVHGESSSDEAGRDSG
jgi:hypothetical protein